MNWLGRQFRTFSALCVVLREKLTPTGRAMLGVVVFCVPFLRNVDSPAVFLGGGFSCLLIFTRIYGRRQQQPVAHVDVRIPPWFQRGIPGRIHIFSRGNSSAAAAATIQLLDPPHGWELRELTVERETGRRTLEMIIPQRGRYQLPTIKVSYTGPFGLHRFVGHKKIRTALHVGPCWEKHAGAVHAEIGETARHLACNTLKRSQIDDEYIGSREYQPGMTVRRWDYPATARRSRPIVREYAGAGDYDVALFVDTSGNKHDSDVGFESLLDATATIAATLLESQIRVAALFTNDRSLVFSSPSAAAVFDQLIQSLATQNSNSGGDIVARIRELPQTATVCIFVAVRGPATEATFASMEQSLPDVHPVFVEVEKSMPHVEKATR